MIGVAAAVAFLLTFGGLIAAVLAGSGMPKALPVWVTLAFFAIKLPVLGLLWWLLGRSEHDGPEEPLPDDRAILAIMRLRESAATAIHTDDAWDRYDMLAAEARYLVVHSSPPISGEAAQLAKELTARRDACRAAAGAG